MLMCTLPPDEMHTTLQQTYASLKALKTQADAYGSVAVAPPETPSKPVNWRKSITKDVVTYLECGASFKAGGRWLPCDGRYELPPKAEGVLRVPSLSYGIGFLCLLVKA
jgi:predicted transcriptional regulator